MRKKQCLFLRVSAFLLSVYAVCFLIYPGLLGELVGFEHHSPNTLVEVTAFYGGLELGLAIFLLWTSQVPDRIDIGLRMIFFVFLTAGLARLIGMIRFGFENPSQPIVTGLEVLWAFVAIWLVRKGSGEVASSSYAARATRGSR